MSSQPGGGRSRAPGPRSQPTPLADVLPSVMGQLGAELFRRGDPPAADPDRPPTRPERPKKEGRKLAGRTAMLGRYVGMPHAIIGNAKLTDADVRLYGAILACCWDDQPFTAATNATLREKMGGVNRLEIHQDRTGRQRARWVAASGPSDDYIRRALKRLETDAGVIRRVDDPLEKSGRLIFLTAPSEWKAGDSE